MANNWYQQKEKSSFLLLKITFYLVYYMPKFILNPIIFCVVFVYFIFLPKERKNIKNFYLHLQESSKQKYSFSIFSNFYEFAKSITDKIAVWLGKIKFDDLILEDKETLDRLFFDGNGKIVIVSHFGNIEIARALSTHFADLKLAILVYDQNSLNFSRLINFISKSDLKVFKVDNLDIAAMIELSNFIKDGGFICIMGDRIPLNSNKLCKVNFLGKQANFPQGGFILASLLKCEVMTLWCITNGKNYVLKTEYLGGNIERKQICDALQKYVKILEENCKKYPQMWFNFFDFWGEN